MEKPTTENGVSNQTSGQDNTLSQESLLYLVVRHRWIILATVAFSLLAAFFYLLKAVPIYTCQSRLYVEQSGPRIIGDYEVMARSMNYLNTQAELIRSASIITGVAENPQVRNFRTFAGAENIDVSLKKDLNVTIGKKDDIFTVSFDSPYPDESAQVVNEVVNSYIEYNSLSKKDTVSKVLDILGKEKITRDKELLDKFKEILEFTKTNGVVSSEGKGEHFVFQKLAKLSEALTDAQLITINSKADYEAVTGMVNEPAKLKQFASVLPTAGVRVLVNDTETSLRTELRKAQTDLLNIKGHVTEDHPSVKALHARIDSIKRELDSDAQEFAGAYLEAMRLKWETAKQRESELETSFKEQRVQGEDLGIKATEYSILQSGLKRAERNCEILDNRVKDLRVNVTEDTSSLNIRILEFAHPATSPSKPDKARIMLLALLLGLVFGGGFALIRDFTDYRLRSVDEIASVLGVPVLGTVPRMVKTNGVSSSGRKVHLEPLSVVAEAYRTIRTAVLFGRPKDQARTILVTSPEPSDGKSTLVSNLAIALAQAGQKTLVIDADLRKPVQHTIFEIDRKKGLSGVLAQTISVEDAIQCSNIEGLDVLSCGPDVPNPSELFSSEAFAGILKKLTEKYDRIVLDSPPVAPVTDSQILSAVCDVTLLVLRAEKSTRRHSQQAREGLAAVGGHVLGVIVNDIPSGFGHYGYSRYGYHSNYGYYHNDSQMNGKTD